jgi:hypothetical protein
LRVERFLSKNGGSEKSRFFVRHSQSELEVTTVSGNAGAQTSSPLLDGAVDDALVELRPLVAQSRLQVINMLYSASVNALLKNSPDLVIHWIVVRLTAAAAIPSVHVNRLRAAAALGSVQVYSARTRPVERTLT